MLDEELEEKRLEEELTTPSWVLHIDGASNVQESGARLILMNLDGVVMEFAL